MTRMKESGIDWIGQIPEEWETSKIRYLVTTRSEKRITDSSVPYIGLENIESQTGKFVKTGIQVDKSENIVVEIGDVLFGKLRPYLRKYWRATFTSTASSEFLVFQSSELDMNFLYYAIQSDSFIEEVNTSTYGSKMPRASWEYIKNMRIAFPTSLVEQQKIADFLDKKTAQLDKVKSLLEEQIQKLKDYRASLIYETVTKGLDKNVPMKDSGIDWIGQIPQGWGVKPLKYLASYDDETLTQSEINSNQKINYVDIGAVEFTKGINSYQEISMSEAPSRARKIAKKGDTIISTVRTYLKAIAYVNDDYIVSTGFCVVRPKKVNSKYLNYAIMSDSFTGPVSKYAWGVSYPAISSSQLVNIPIPFPESIEEQLSIVDYLDHKMLQINQLIDIKQEQIDNINKQRQTLIYDYVTGKRRGKEI